MKIVSQTIKNFETRDIKLKEAWHNKDRRMKRRPDKAEEEWKDIGGVDGRCRRWLRKKWDLGGDVAVGLIQ